MEQVMCGPEQPKLPSETPKGPQQGPAPADPGGEERPSESAVLAGLPLGLFVLDSADRFLYLNAYAERFLERVCNRGRDELLAKPIWEACPEVADSAFRREWERAVAEERDFELEVFYPALDRWLTLQGRLAASHRPFFLQDVTQRVKLERSARRLAEQLAAAEGGKGEFLVRLAHRLRNALVPVRNALHLMTSKAVADPEAEQVSALGEREVEHLSRLTDDLLKVSQVTAGRLHPRPERFDLARVLAQSVDAALASGAGRGRSVTVNLPPEPLEILADPALTREVVTHLLDNAIRFTAPGGQIWLAALRDEDAIEVSVRDNGVGISPELLPGVFDLFMRMESSGERAHGEGLGIGLTLVRKLVELQGGTVEAHSAGAGQGSEFRVRLAAAPPPAAEPRPGIAGSIGPHGPPLRVQVIDDNRQTAQSIAMLLSHWGYEVRISYDGESALREALAWRPDVVLLDIGMPGMDGYQVAARLRGEESLQGVVLVALTGYAEDEVRQRAEESGFHHYLVKPVPPAILHDLLSAAEAAVRDGRAHPPE